MRKTRKSKSIVIPRFKRMNSKERVTKPAIGLNFEGTKGRGKLDIKNEYTLPVKNIYVYPL